MEMEMEHHFAHPIGPMYVSAAVGESIHELCFGLKMRWRCSLEMRRELEKLKELLSVVEAEVGKEIKEAEATEAIKNENLMQLKDFMYEAADLLDTSEYRRLERTKQQLVRDDTHWESPNDIIKLSDLVKKLETIACNVRKFIQLSSSEVKFENPANIEKQYLQLPACLQDCFAYLSLYPKDWRFTREEVIQMWMAQGMIYDGKRKIMAPRYELRYLQRIIHSFGEGYFWRLKGKSFFQSSGDDDHYTIHYQLYDFIESVSKDDCFRVEGDEFRTIPSTIRHLFINKKHLARLKENASLLNNLRTLILQGDFSHHPNDVDHHLQEVILQLKSIRSLTLRNCHLERCPDNLNTLIHLRFLDLSGNCEIKELPDELTMLYHLQTLNLFQLELDHIPASLNKLISLQRLICSSRVLSMVEGIGELTELQQLSCPFYMQNVPRFDIRQLKDLLMLGGRLCIRHLENVESKRQASEAKLCEKIYLEDLELHWGSTEMNTNPEVESGVLDCLMPSSNIRKLHINGYKGTLSPSWFYTLFNKLVSIKLTNCNNWKELPAIGKFTFLEVLEISGMHALSIFRSDGSEYPILSLRKLRKLTFDDLREWKMWLPHDKSFLFSKLEILQISECPKLTEIPQFPPTVKRLELFNVGLSKFPELPTKSQRFSVLSIKGCPNLRFPGEWLLDQHENLEYLTELTVDPRGELDISLVKAINKLTGLKRLCIDSWPYEQILDDDDDDDKEEEEKENVDYYKEEDCGLFPGSLESLEIINCFVAGKILWKSLQGLRALQLLRLDWCSCPTILPSKEGMQKLTALSRLEVTNCRGFTSLVGLGALYALRDLKVIGCPELIPLPSSGSDEIDVVVGEKVGLLAPSTLCIDNTLLLKVLLSGQGLASLKELEIIFLDQAEIDEKVFHPLMSLQSLRFEACHNLKTLPPLKNLQSLKKLEIEDCSNFRSLPSEEDLPPLLAHISVRRCRFNYVQNIDKLKEDSLPPLKEPLFEIKESGNFWSQPSKEDLLLPHLSVHLKNIDKLKEDSLPPLSLKYSEVEDCCNFPSLSTKEDLPSPAAKSGISETPKI